MVTRRNRHPDECRNPRRHCFLCLVTLTFDLLTAKQTGFQGSRWITSTSSLVILAAAGIEISCRKQRDRQMHRQTNASTVGVNYKRIT